MLIPRAVVIVEMESGEAGAIPFQIGLPLSPAEMMAAVVAEAGEGAGQRGQGGVQMGGVAQVFQREDNAAAFGGGLHPPEAVDPQGRRRRRGGAVRQMGHQDGDAGGGAALQGLDKGGGVAVAVVAGRPQGIDPVKGSVGILNPQAGAAGQLRLTMQGAGPPSNAPQKRDTVSKPAAARRRRDSSRGRSYPK